LKTLIFNGSPRENGDTAFLIEKLVSSLSGETKTVCSYFSSVSPCIDCRRCFKTGLCCIDDDMQGIYRDITDADAIVIASPVYFGELTGSLLNLLSRIQVFFASQRLFGEPFIKKPKAGLLILCGGGSGAPTAAEETARMLFKSMNVRDFRVVRSLKTDDIPSSRDDAALFAISSAAKFLNESFSK